MKIIESFTNLLEKSSTSIFFNLSIGALLFDVLMKTNALNIISHNAYFLLGFY